MASGHPITTEEQKVRWLLAHRELWTARIRRAGQRRLARQMKRAGLITAETSLRNLNIPNLISMAQMVAADEQ